jgi:hypothetical protein
MNHPTTPFSHESTTVIGCFPCPCGCVVLRWNRTLLHLDFSDLACAAECLNSVLGESSGSFFLGENQFCACRAKDGYYYLMCQDSVVSRLMKNDAQRLRTELIRAKTTLEKQFSLDQTPWGEHASTQEIPNSACTGS